IVFESCSVSADSVLGDIGRGIPLALRAINGGRLNVSAGCAGLARACLDESIAHVTTRVQFDRELAAFQLVQGLVVDIALRAHSARQAYRHAARLLDAGLDARVECSAAKVICTEAAAVAGANAAQLH